MIPPRLRGWWLLVPVMALIGGILEAAAAGSVFVLIRALDNPASAAELPVVAPLLRWFPVQNAESIVLQVTALVVAFYIVKNLILIGMQYLRHRIIGESSAELACTMLRGYLLVPYPFHFRRNSAELIRNTTASVGAVFRALEGANVVLLEVFIGAGILAVLLAASPGVTLLTGGGLTLVIALLLRFTRRMAQRGGTEEHELGRELYQTLQNALGGIKEVKALGREEFFHRAFAETQRRRLSLGYLGITMNAVPQLVIETAFVCGALSVVALITMRGPAGSEVLPLVGLFAYAGFRMVPMANRLTWRLNELRASREAVDSLYEDYRLVLREEEDDDEAVGAQPGFEERLLLDDVTYIYPGNAAPALRDVRLSIRKGESIGIVGPTGSGKSTLVDLIVGLLIPTSGSMTVDGEKFVGTRKSWRRQVGYVPQSIFLLDDTLRRNIALGIPDGQIDEEAIRRAVRLAQLGGFVDALPAGLDTSLGERGIHLSGGERQRVGIARALYHDPDLLVFDEATASLDNITEAELTRAIESLRGMKTMVVIAHRLSTVRGCDRLIFLQEGRVRATGSYAELLREEPEFRRMAETSPLTL